jgi:hypothetical protein
LVEQVGGHAVYDNPNTTLPSYVRQAPDATTIYPEPDRLKVPFCGVKQRIVADTTACSLQPEDATGAAQVPSTQTETAFGPDASGNFFDQTVTSPGCVHYEPRTFSLDCPGGAVCNAGGVCVRTECSISGQCGTHPPVLVNGEGKQLSGG